MMKRIFMLLALALMVVAAMALSGVAQAASPTVRCLQEAESLTGSTLTGYNVVVGNNRKADDFTSKGTEGVADVFCGRGGDDFITSLEYGDIFIGGAGNDHVDIYNFGTVYGGAGNDNVHSNSGTFYGGDGSDSVYGNFGPYDGGDGSDTVGTNYLGGSIVNVEIILF